MSNQMKACSLRDDLNPTVNGEQISISQIPGHQTLSGKQNEMRNTGVWHKSQDKWMLYMCSCLSLFKCRFLRPEGSHLQINVWLDYGVGWMWGFLIPQNMWELDFTGKCFRIVENKDDFLPRSNLRYKLVLCLVRPRLYCRYMESWKDGVKSQKNETKD